MMNGGPYSELEYLILALVGEGVSSGYAMRKRMNHMRGGRWSSESGSVYRVLRRLERDGLVGEARRVGVPNRERTEYELSEQGNAVLQSWLTFTPDRQEFSYLVDPIRTRAYFITRLKPSEQARVVKNWIAESKSFVGEMEREIDGAQIPDAVRAAAYTNLLFLAQARHEWLKKLLTIIRTASSGAKDLLEAPEPEEAAIS
jgi:DNA-binding PadR family transcriptional regulator